MESATSKRLMLLLHSKKKATLIPSDMKNINVPLDCRTSDQRLYFI